MISTDHQLIIKTITIITIIILHLTSTRVMDRDKIINKWKETECPRERGVIEVPKII